MPQLVRKNASSTQRGESFDRKQYIVGTAYTNGTPLVTGTGWTTTRAVLIPYQTSDGAWRLTFNINGTITSASRSGVVVAVSGIVFRSGVIAQAISALSDSSVIGMRVYADAGVNTLGASHAATTTSYYIFSGDVELESKPTWAD